MSKITLRILSLMLAALMLASIIACTKSPTASDIPTDATEENDRPTEKPTDKPEEPQKPSLAEPVELSARTYFVSFSKPAIPANVGDEIDLSLYSVQLRRNGEPTTASEIEWSSDEIKIESSKVTPAKSGIYTLTASAGKRSLKVYLVVKEVDDEEYLLYYNDFNSDTALDDITKVSANGNASYKIEEGKLVLDASGSESDSVRVLLPSWLSAFGDYTITSNMTITEKANESRWCSIMYRVQNNDSPYYHLCLRANTSSSSGVELACRNAASQWEYQTKTSYTEDFAPDKLYSVVLKASGNDADIYIDGEFVGGGYGIDSYRTGSIGMQASGSTAVFDDIKVTLDFEPEEPSALAPTVISRVNSESDLDSLLVGAPDIAIMTVDPDGNLLDKDGTTICTIADAEKKLAERTILALELSGKYEFEVSATAALIRSLDRTEVMVISAESVLVGALRREIKSMLAVIDFSAKALSPIEMRTEARLAGARICLLPSEMADPAITEALNSLNMTVWYESTDSSAVDAFRLITSGANGIIAADRALLRACLNSSLFSENSLLRPIGIIGHRGMPSQAPENTLAGSALGATYGANIIENDIYITKDGVLVVMHDGTVDRTTNGTGKVEDFTYTELCELLVDDKPDSGSSLPGRIDSAQPIPTLEEYFVEFKNTDTLIFIEIKSSSTARLVPALRELIDEYDFYSQCNVICFSQDTLKAINETIPELSVGYLCSTSSLSAIADATASCTSSYNPSASYVSSTLVKHLADRGIFTWPWTVNDKAGFDSLFLMGVAGITTNYPNFAQNYVKRISTDKSAYEAKVGESIEIDIRAELYGADKNSESFENSVVSTDEAEMFLIEGNPTLNFDGKTVSATEAGEATVIFRFSFKLSNGKLAYVYTQPVSINVK